jgi:hypothetical protein
MFLYVFYRIYIDIIYKTYVDLALTRELHPVAAMRRPSCRSRRDLDLY